MIEIDGGQGGGAVVRTAVGLAVATNTSVRITDIRAERPNPGLQAQHLAGIRAAAALADAELVGVEQESQTLTFVPNHRRLQQDIRIDIPTAGSVALALQPLQIGMLGADESVDVVVDGGATAGKWAPPIDYLCNVTVPVLRAHGYTQSLDVKRNGFYPEGGALLHATIGPADSLTPLDLMESDDIVRVDGVSRATTHLEDAEVAERQRKAARRVIANEYPSIDMDIATEYVDARSPGSVITLWTTTADDRILGADALGEKGKRSERVGSEAAESLLDQLDADAAVDGWLADQLIPVLAVTGGRMTVPAFTDHVEHNLRVARQIVDRDWQVDRDRNVVGVV